MGPSTHPSKRTPTMHWSQEEQIRLNICISAAHFKPVHAFGSALSCRPGHGGPSSHTAPPPPQIGGGVERPLHPVNQVLNSHAVSVTIRHATGRDQTQEHSPVGCITPPASIEVPNRFTSAKCQLIWADVFGPQPIGQQALPPTVWPARLEALPCCTGCAPRLRRIRCVSRH